MNYSVTVMNASDGLLVVYVSDCGGRVGSVVYCAGTLPRDAVQRTLPGHVVRHVIGGLYKAAPRDWLDGVDGEPGSAESEQK